MNYLTDQGVHFDFFCNQLQNLGFQTQRTLMALVPKIKYLTNKDLLSAIHESKLTFCEFVDKKYTDFDVIVYDLAAATPEVLDAARHKKLANKIAEEKKASGSKTFESSLTLDNVPLDEIVVRLMTFVHIPLNPAKADKAKNQAEKHIRCNFPPFQHWIFQNNEWKCVGKSHHKKGEFTLTGGRITDRLAAMWIKLVDRYGHRGNWRGYTYLDEMKAQALVQLAQVGLQFDEAKSSNPFAYYTTVSSTSFLKILQLEKRSQHIRDDLLIMHGATPSHTRQTEDQLAQQLGFDNAEAAVPLVVPQMSPTGPI